jgi:hypothetical protein
VHRAPGRHAGLVRRVRRRQDLRGAQAALAELRTEHRTDMQALLEKYGIDASRCTGGGMMGGGYGAGNGCGMAQAN